MVAPDVLVLRMVKLPPLSPSMITKLQPLRLKIAVPFEPLISTLTPLAGRIVTVLVALEPGLALMAMGKVSDPE